MIADSKCPDARVQGPEMHPYCVVVSQNADKTVEVTWAENQHLK